MNMVFRKIGSVAGAIASLTSQAAMAATTPNSLVTPQTPSRGVVRFLQGTDSAGTLKTIYTAGANGSRCYGLFMTNSDNSTTHLVNVYLTNAGFSVNGPAVTTVLAAGVAAGVAPQPLMTSTVWPALPVDQYNNPYVQMVSGDTLQATFATVLSTSAQITMYAVCNDF
jgi:hypothetical protein